jgi:phosphoribosylanthranilate isomerase
MIEFVPSKEEILKKIEEISKCQNMSKNEKYVYAFIKENYQKIENLSLRTYIKAVQLFIDNKKEWKERFLSLIGFDEKVIEYLRLKEKYNTVEEMVKNYKWSRSTFFRIKQEVEE